MSASKQTILSVEHLKKYFQTASGQLHAVDDCNLFTGLRYDAEIVRDEDHRHVKLFTKRLDCVKHPCA